MKVDLDLDLPAGAKAPGVARRFLRGLKGYLPPERYDTVELLVSELVTNSFRHAGLNENDLIKLRVTTWAHTLRVEVLDCGPGFAVRARDRSSPQGSGWGLYLVDHLADRWGVDRKQFGNAVWFEVDGVPDRIAEPAH